MAEPGVPVVIAAPTASGRIKAHTIASGRSDDAPPRDNVTRVGNWLPPGMTVVMVSKELAFELIHEKKVAEAVDFVVDSKPVE